LRDGGTRLASPIMTRMARHSAGPSDHGRAHRLWRRDSHGCQHASIRAVAVVPIMVVKPLLQLSLVFRLIRARGLNREPETFGPRSSWASAVAVNPDLLIALTPDEGARALWQFQRPSPPPAASNSSTCAACDAPSAAL